jgi:hypothetical protein
MAIEFIVERHEFVLAFMFVRPSPLRTRQARKAFVNVHARKKSGIELASVGTSSSLPAEVISRGDARVPIWFFEWFRKAARTLHQRSVHVSIFAGQVKADNLTYSHPDVTLHARRRKKLSG